MAPPLQHYSGRARRSRPGTGDTAVRRDETGPDLLVYPNQCVYIAGVQLLDGCRVGSIRQLAGVHQMGIDQFLQIRTDWHRASSKLVESGNASARSFTLENDSDGSHSLLRSDRVVFAAAIPDKELLANGVEHID